MNLMTTALALGLLLAGGEATTAPVDAFSAIDAHYQSIRLALLQDSSASVSEHAAAIAKAADELAAAPTAASAGVSSENLPLVSELLPEVSRRASALASAEGLRAQRDALKLLTQPLVRWHEKLTAAKPRVAYCSMERGAWFQPDGVLGNPYGGTRMPRCGQFVDE